MWERGPCAIYGMSGQEACRRSEEEMVMVDANVEHHARLAAPFDPSPAVAGRSNLVHIEDELKVVHSASFNDGAQTVCKTSR